LNLGHAQAQTKENVEKALLPYKRQKTLKAGDLMIYKAGTNNVAENKSRPLDLARADPTAAIRSQYRIGGRAMGHTYMGNVLL